MKNIIFFARYPNNENLQDGFYVRVKNIDNIFINENRIYLCISILHNYHFNETKKNNLIIVNANIFLHYFKIKKLFHKSNIFYIHSLHNFLWTIFLPIPKNNKIIWDVHGAVPEEFKFNKKIILAYIFNLLEKYLYHRADLIITVTQAMYKFLSLKYNVKNKNYFVFPIINNLLLSENNISKVNVLRNELNLSTNDIVFIYSGSLLKWQRFDEIAKIIEKCNNPNYYFIILTGQINEVKKLIINYNLISKRILIKTVLPEELPIYYAIANFGFILRNNHILNKVAAPTKLLEYMYYGLIPIVDYEKIGDFYELNYEYIHYTKINDQLFSNKSIKNIQIIKNIINTNNKENFKLLVLK